MDDALLTATRPRVCVVGVNHETAPLDIRERLAVNLTQIEPFTEALREVVPGAECVLVSTCNRVEVYLAGRDETIAAAALSAICEFRHVDRAKVAPHVYTYEHRDCVRHLFRVAASLDSMVVGEAEVLGQVKAAYAAAAEHGCTGKALNPLFQRAFSIAKRVRTETMIGQGRVSVASVAVDFCKRIFSSLSDKTILVIGAGEAAEGVLKSLVGQGATAVLVANRTYDRAVRLSDLYEGSAIRFDRLNDHLGLADIIVGSSAAPHVVIKAEDVAHAHKQRRNRPMLFLDLSSPRDIDPAVHDLDNVYLYDLDDLKEVVEQHLDLRSQEVATAMAIIDEAVAESVAELEAPDLGPSIAAVRASWHAIRAQEVQRTLGRLNGAGDDVQREIEQLSERLVNKLLHQPTQQVKAAAREPDGYHTVRAFLRLLHWDRDQPR